MSLLNIISRDPVASRWSTLIYVMLARLVLLTLIMIALATLSSYRLDHIAVSAFLVITYLITIVYALWLRHEETTRNSALYQFAVDVFIITGLVHFTGGVNSTLSLLYPLVILAAAIVISGAMAIRVAILSLVLYSTTVVLELTGALPYQGPFPSPYDNPERVAQTIMIQLLLLVFFAAASSYLADQYFAQARQLQRLKVIAKATLDNVAVPLLAVQSDGHIAAVNPSACNMLGRHEEALLNARFADLFAESVPDPDSEEDARRIWHMKRPDNTAFPVSFEVSQGSFPATVLNISQNRSEDVDLHLLAFRDMTELLRQQDEQRNNDKQQAAAEMVTEMVHVVRNPLSAIRGASELINAAVESALSHQSEITGKDFVTLKSMCELIFEQTRELDDKVGQFFQYAAHDRAKLLELLADADKWTAELAPEGSADHG